MIVSLDRFISFETAIFSIGDINVENVTLLF